MEANPSPLPPALLLLFMLCLSLITPPSSLPTTTATATIDEATPLLAFKNLIQKDINGVLSNWKPNTNPCKWYGITCSAQNRVTHLDLSQCNLFANLSAAFRSFSYLQSLTILNLSGNSFTMNSNVLIHLPTELSQLLMSFSGLVGTLPESLFTNCPNLVFVDLSFNNLTGPVPDNFLLNAAKLQSLDLSYNNISGSFSDLKFFPTSCNSLTTLDMSENQLTGSIPESISSCKNLQTLTLASNQLSGDIPAEIGELKSLQKLDISDNVINGWIPWQLGNTCNALIELKLSRNNISGPVPASLASCKWLQILDISNNNVSGSLPDSLLKNLTSLERLILSNNMISGPFPRSISSCTKLKIMDLSSNRFSGTIPDDICPGAASLEELRLPDNRVTGSIPATLSKCSNLKTLDFSLNYLTGSIPPEIGKLEKLQQLIAWYNGLEGRIPSELGSCRSLKNLILNNNFLTGEMPPELFNCGDLEWISLTSNRVTGEIPREFGLLERLAVLQLGNNSLSGKLPTELGNCSSLVWLDLSSNKLTGEIPPHIGRQPGSKALSGILSGNTLIFVRNIGNSCRGVGGLLEFAGIRPERLQQVPSLKSCDFTRLYSGPVLSLFTQYQTLEYLDLSYNQLHGKIPDEFGNMEALQVLELSNNQLSGEIPQTFGELKNLGVFDASHNRLQGRIPDSFSKLSFLVQIDLSYNELTGEIPQRGQLSTLPAEQYAHNPGLCGPPLDECGSAGNGGNVMTPNSTDTSFDRKSQGANIAHSGVMYGVLISVVSVSVLIIWGLAMRAKRREAEQIQMLGSLKANHAATTWKIDKEKEPLSINVATFQRQLRKLKFSQLIEATNGFSAASLIGSGGFGEVFRATLKDGSSVAIKKLVQLSCQGDREFMSEMETLGKIKHKNLVPLLGYCKIGDERLLVYEFMYHGSLEEVLHGSRNGTKSIITWDARKKIARGAAKGLCFLHHNCIPHIIHRDMKSSNVLLDNEMEAKVSDFGMARLISALDTHLSVSTLAGTPGYVPPEYYQSFRCTAKGDVYSLGVVLLELITGKRPTDKEEFGDTNLVGWAKMKVREGKGMEVIDEELRSGTDDSVEDLEHRVKEMIRYLEITMQCVEDFPSRRPNMLQVVAMLRDLNVNVAPGSCSNSG